MCTFVHYKGSDDLRVTHKTTKRRTYMMPVNSNMAPSPAGDRQRLHQIERGNDAGLLYHSSSIADENHRFPKGNHVTGTDTTSGPGIEELSC